MGSHRIHTLPTPQQRRQELTRTRRTAKQAGARFERLIADYLRDTLDDDNIDRRPKTGAKDRGDIAGVHDHKGRRIVIECKDYGGQIQPAQWLTEAHREARHDNAHVAIVAAKRRGTQDPGSQYVLMTLEDLTNLLN